MAKKGTTLGMSNSVMAQTFLLAGSQALSILTAPGPRRATKEDFVVNPGEPSDLWPYIRGTVETTPHFINYFDFASKKVKNDAAIKDILLTAGIDGLAGFVAGGGSFLAPPPPTAYQGLAFGAVSGAIVAGLGQLRTASYRYYCGFVYGVGHGLIDECVGVKVDERIVSNGSAADNQFLIDDPQAWGGDHKDGGVYALAQLTKGQFWPLQQPNPYLVDMLGSEVPAFSGKSIFIIYGPSGFRESGYFAASAGESPILRPLKLRVRALPSNLGVPEYRNVNDGDANLAELAYEWFTSPAFGVKKFPSSRLDLDSFRAGAQIHHEEGLGVSFEWNQRIDVDTALERLQSIGSSILWGRFRNGTIKYKPIRRDYVIGDLPVLRRGPSGQSDPSLYNVIRVEGFTPGSWSSTVTGITGEYIDRNNNYKSTPFHVQDAANRRLTGTTREVSQDLEGISTGTTAALVGTRELRAGCYPRPPITIMVNRTAYSYEPGDVVKYIDDVDNFTKILRIAEVEDGALGGNEIRLNCVEDQFGVGAAAYSAPADSGFIDPVADVAAAALAKVQEAPRALTGDDDARLLVFAAKPNNATQDFDVYVSTDGGTNYLQESSASDFAITGVIAEAVERLTDPVINELTFTPSNAFDASRLQSATAEEIAGGNRNLIYWEDSGEFMAVESITENVDGSFTLENIWRAVHPYDSVPALHAAGGRVWFFSYGCFKTTTEYPNSTATKTKLRTRTLSAVLPLASATAIDVTIGTRALKPNPVRNVLINSDYLVTLIDASADVQVDWNETNRLIESAIVKQDADSATPEDGVTYTVRWYATEAGTNILLRTESGLTATTATLTTTEEIASPNYLGHLSLAYRVEIDVLREGHTSTTYIREVARPVPLPTITVAITVIAPSVTTTVAPAAPIVSVGITVIEPSVNSAVSLSIPVASVGITVVAPDVTLGAPPAAGNVLAAQVLDWSKEESIADVGASPDVLHLEVFE